MSARRALTLEAGGRRLAAEWLGPAGDAAPTLVFLHHGTGSIGQWRDVPLHLAETTGCGALVYDRFGHGASEPLPPPYARPPDFMHREARVVPEVLDRAGVRSAVLVGHSDGGSIALLAAAAGDARIRGVAALAAHVFVEEKTLNGVTAAVAAWRSGRLRERLRRHHGDNADGAFLGWATVWASPEFETFHIEGHLRRIVCPVLAVQGADDAYGTPAQIETIAAAVGGPRKTMLVPDCGHEPHLEARGRVLPALARFAVDALAPAGPANDDAPPST